MHDDVSDVEVGEPVSGALVPLVPRQFSDVELAAQLVEQARTQGLKLVGPDGLLTQMTRRVLESALEAEMADHLGYEKGDPAGRGVPNSRNGHSSKTVHTDVGPVQIRVPRDMAGQFEPQIVPKHVRRVGGFDEAILSLYAKGLTTGEIQAHLADVYGAEVSRDLISRVTDAVIEEMTTWRNRPLDRIYPVVFIDALVVKVREGQVANRPAYIVAGVSADGDRDMLGVWIGTGGEGAKQWLSYLTELKNRGVQDVFIVCSDGLRGITDAIEMVWPRATHQTCVVHLVRASLRYSARKDWQAITPMLRDIYTAPTADAAAARFTDFETRWGTEYPAMIGMWRESWEGFTPFLQYDQEIRKVVYTTNMIESLNARFRQATRRRGHFPSEQAALKVLYLVIQDKQGKGKHLTGRINGWKKALNAFALIYADRLTEN
jgi:putative transposase